MGVFEQFPYTNFHDLNLDWILQKLKEWDGSIQSFYTALEALKEYEKSANITSSRKLSAKGDFTGKIQGRDSLLLLAQTDSNADALKFLGNQFSDGQTGFVIDGGFFDEEGIKTNYNGGMF